MRYLHGHNGIVPGLEAALEGKSVGDTLSVTLSPEEAYGERDDTRIHVFTKEELGGLGELSVGMQLQAEDSSHKRILTVSKIEDNKITLDENHPMAGKTVSFDVTVIDVRNATDEELGSGDFHSIHCTDDCGTCGLNTPSGCGDSCGCDHH